MRRDSRIESVMARQIFSFRGFPGVEATVITENGARGIAVAAGGASVGKHEVQFVFDGGERWGGQSVMKAVSNVNDIIAPALKEADATKQRKVDEILIELDGTPNKSRLGGNATASVSAAILKAGAASLGIPLYQHIGGVNACTLPIPGVLTVAGSTRYRGGQRSGGKPSYSFQSYGFSTFSEASYACGEVMTALGKIMREKYNLSFRGTAYNLFLVQAGMVEHDRELWDIMAEAINSSGNEGKVGIQVDIAAGTYYDKDRDVFVGLFSREDKTKGDLIELYKDMVKNYPFVILEDPLDEDDYEGHALLTKELGIQIVGDDLFTENIERLKHGIEVGACNTLLLKPNRAGTISEAFDVAQLAHSKGYGVMPSASRGDGPAIADYAVGLSAGTIRESGLDPAANRFLEIESELGSRAKFLGRVGIKGLKL